MEDLHQPAHGHGPSQTLIGEPWPVVLEAIDEKSFGSSGFFRSQRRRLDAAGSILGERVVSVIKRDRGMRTHRVVGESFSSVSGEPNVSFVCRGWPF